MDITRYGAVNQQHERPGLSDQYTFIPTTRVIDVMDSRGWIPSRITEAKALKHQGYQTHMIRFRQRESQPLAVVGDTHPEIVLTNNHAGVASFTLMAALFRLACSNGMIVADSTFQKVSIRHVGYADELVMEAIEGITDTLPRIGDKVKDFKQIELTRDEQEVFAMSSLLVKYGDEEVERRNFDPSRLLEARRRSDDSPTLWSTYNKVQENLINGGRFERSKVKRTMMKSRKVSSVTEDVRINQGLWLLTEQMAKMKGAN